MLKILLLLLFLGALGGCKAMAVIGAAVVPGGIPIYAAYEAWCHSGHMQEPKCQAALLKGHIRP